MQLTFKRLFLILFLFPVIGSCQQKKTTKKSAKETSYEVVKTDAEWQEILTPLSYRVFTPSSDRTRFFWTTQ